LDEVFEGVDLGSFEDSGVDLGSFDDSNLMNHIVSPRGNITQAFETNQGTQKWRRNI